MKKKLGSSANGRGWRFRDELFISRFRCVGVGFERGRRTKRSLPARVRLPARPIVRRGSSFRRENCRRAAEELPRITALAHRHENAHHGKPAAMENAADAARWRKMSHRMSPAAIVSCASAGDERGARCTEALVVTMTAHFRIQRLSVTPPSACKPSPREERGVGTGTPR